MAAEGLVAEAEAWRLTMEFFTGYLIEKALAIDNVFVFAVIFSSFGIVARFQHKILFYGVLGALVFRMIFIALGFAIVTVPAKKCAQPKPAENPPKRAATATPAPRPDGLPGRCCRSPTRR